MLVKKMAAYKKRFAIPAAWKPALPRSAALCLGVLAALYGVGMNFAEAQDVPRVASQAAIEAPSVIEERRARRKANGDASRFLKNNQSAALERPIPLILPAEEKAGEKELNGKIIEENYTAFVESLSMLLNSLGNRQLSRETRNYLRSIPAGKLESMTHVISPKQSVEIYRGEETDIFGEPKQDIPEDEVGLNISIKQPGRSTVQTLQMAHDALTAGQTEGASALYKQVLEHDPQNKQALFGLAASYHKRGQLDQARDTYLQVLKLDEKYEPAINNMLMLAREEGPDEALQQLFKLEQSNPEFSPIPAQIGMLYFERNDLEQAAKYLTRAIILAPENLNYRYNLAVVLDKMGRTDQAARLYTQLIKAGAEGKELPESTDKIQERLTYIRSRSGDEG